MLQVLSDGHVRVSPRSEVLLRGDDCVCSQLSSTRSVTAGLEDRYRMPHILTHVIASIPCRLRLFVVASHCFFTPSTFQRFAARLPDQRVEMVSIYDYNNNILSTLLEI